MEAWKKSLFSLELNETPNKEPIFADLSVSKTYFTDKPVFSSDLSVNFGPLWWWFTDTSRFLDHLSVKPGPKRLNFYGQTVHFHRFVRKRQWFCQMQRLIKQHAKLFCLFPSWKAIVTYTQKTGSNLQSIANLIRFLDLRQSFFPTSFWCLELKFVIKNATLSQNVNLTVTWPLR